MDAPLTESVVSLYFITFYKRKARSIFLRKNWKTFSIWFLSASLPIIELRMRTIVIERWPVMKNKQFFRGASRETILSFTISFQSEVNFTNILSAAFLYENFARSFFCTFILDLYLFSSTISVKNLLMKVGDDFLSGP